MPSPYASIEDLSLFRVLQAQQPGSARDAIRNELIERYLPAVRKIAAGLYARTPKFVEFDDLESSGTLGLMAAVESFDPDVGVRFRTYADLRIRGAMIDGMRDMDWVPRLTRQRHAMVTKATAQLQAELKRPPTCTEIAQRLSVPATEFEKIYSDFPVSTSSLSAKRFETDNGTNVNTVHLLIDAKAPDPLRSIQLKSFGADVTRGLSRAEKLIIILYYGEAMTMKEIGRVVGMSESRISQMHSNLICRLRARMERAAA